MLSHPYSVIYYFTSLSKEIEESKLKKKFEEKGIEFI